MSEIHRADPAMRRLTVYAIVIAAAAGAAGFIMFRRWFASVQLLPPDQATAALLGALTWTCGVMLLIVAATSIYAWRMGSRIKQTGQYPPQGARTIRDTAILDGAKARSRGHLLQTVGVMLLILAILLLVLCVLLVRNLPSGTV